MFASLAFADGVLATGVTTPVSGSVFPFPGSEVVVEPAASATAPLAVGMSSGWGPLVAGLVVGVLVARPWRAVSAWSSNEATASS